MKKNNILCFSMMSLLLAGTAGAATPENVARAQFAAGIENREPLNAIERLDNASDQIWFFTEFVNAAGERLIHRWEFDGEVMAEVPFDVGGNRWRVWSSKQLLPEWLGAWKVSIVDGEGNTIASREFNYVAAETAGTEAETEPAADTPADQ